MRGSSLAEEWQKLHKAGCTHRGKLNFFGWSRSLVREALIKGILKASGLDDLNSQQDERALDGAELECPKVHGKRKRASAPWGGRVPLDTKHPASCSFTSGT